MRKMNSEGNVEDIRICDEIYKKFKSVFIVEDCIAPSIVSWSGKKTLKQY